MQRAYYLGETLRRGFSGPGKFASYARFSIRPTQYFMRGAPLHSPIPNISPIHNKFLENFELFPNRDVIFYDNDTRKMSLQELMHLSRGYAYRMIHNGLRPGHRLCVWTETEIPEKHALFLAMARCGGIFVEIDSSINTEKDLLKCLRIVEPVVFVFSPTVVGDESVEIIESIFPEVVHVDHERADTFRNRAVPTLVQMFNTGTEFLPTGEEDIGIQPLSQWASYTVPEEFFLRFGLPVTSDLPFYVKYSKDKDGQIIESDILTQQQVIDSNQFPLIDAVVKRQVVRFNGAPKKLISKKDEFFKY